MNMRDILQTQHNIDPYRLFHEESIKKLVAELETLLEDEQFKQKLYEDRNSQENILKVVSYLYLRSLASRKPVDLNAPAIKNLKERPGLFSDSFLTTVYGIPA